MNEENNNTFQSQDTPYTQTFKPVSSTSQFKNYSFSKSVLIPFISGVVGASSVLGICFGIPNIRQSLLNSSNESTLNITPGGTSTAISLKDYSDTAIAVASKVQPSIVGIQIEYSVTTIFGNMSSNATASGSGIIISEDGYILTNNHVVSSSSSSSYYQMSEAQKITVSLFDREETYDAKIVGTDAQTDLAIIKIEADGLTAAELGDSDNVKVGEFAMAIGNPLGLDSSVTCGIISAVNRKVSDDEGNTYLAIQTDSSINSGNSGGALVNSEGKVIGINTLKLSGTGVEGIGFAIPINSTIDVCTQLIKYSKVIRPYIGITGRDIDSDLASKHKLVVGVYITSIDQFSAAELAGLRIGDIITAADGTTIKTMDELNNIKNTHKVGDKMTLTLYRNGENMDITVTLKEQ